MGYVRRRLSMALPNTSRPAARPPLTTTPGADPDSTNPAVKRDYFLRREFTFTMAEDVYIRYLCFRDQAGFEKAVNAKQPYKIDIGKGGVYVGSGCISCCGCYSLARLRAAMIII